LKLDATNKPAWLAITILISTLSLALVAGIGPILILIFHLGPLSVALFLFRRYPTFYLNFALWLWFIYPLVSRFASYRLGYTIPGSSATAPMVSALTFITLLKSIPKIYRDGDQNYLPFLLCLGSVLYSSIIRFIRYPFGQSILNDFGLVIQSLTPITIGYYLYSNWRYYQLYKKSLLKSIVWIVMVMGSYGIFQFLVAPEWDKQFLLNSVGFASYYGLAEPLGMRVWSTMTNPLSFGVNLMALLVLLNTCSNGWLRFIAAGLGYLTFLLSQSRTGWYSWLLAIVMILFSTKGSKQIYFFSSLLIVFLGIIFTASQEPFLSLIVDRFESFSNLSEDVSAAGRLQQINSYLNLALSEFVGQGNGSEPYLGNLIASKDSDDFGFLSGYDMGFIQILIAFGWLGATPYITGLLLITSKLFLNFHVQDDLFAVSARSIALASIVRVLTTNIVWGEFALPIWLSLGFAMAALKFYSANKDVYISTKFI
jgi:hypothetical protein